MLRKTGGTSTLRGLVSLGKPEKIKAWRLIGWAKVPQLNRKSGFLRALAGTGRLLIRRPSLRNRRLARRILTVSPKGLVSLDGVVRLANDRELPGAIIECGAWNGGSVAMMGAACSDHDGRTPREF